jgi:hypothetical protein
VAAQIKPLELTFAAPHEPRNPFDLIGEIK